MVRALWAIFAILLWNAISPALAVEVDFTPIMKTGVEFLYVVLTGLLGWVSYALTSWLSTKTKVNKAVLDQTLGALLNDGLHRGIDLAYAAAIKAVQDPNNPARSVKIDNPFVAIAANYVIPRFPESLAHFGWGPEDVKRAIIARASAYLANQGIPTSDPLVDLVAAEGAVAAARVSPTSANNKNAPAADIDDSPAYGIDTFPKGD